MFYTLCFLRVRSGIDSPTGGYKFLIGARFDIVSGLADGVGEESSIDISVSIMPSGDNAWGTSVSSYMRAS